MVGRRTFLRNAAMVTVAGSNVDVTSASTGTETDQWYDDDVRFISQDSGEVLYTEEDSIRETSAAYDADTEQVVVDVASDLVLSMFCNETEGMNAYLSVRIEHDAPLRYVQQTGDPLEHPHLDVEISSVDTDSTTIRIKSNLLADEVQDRFFDVFAALEDGQGDPQQYGINDETAETVRTTQPPAYQLNLHERDGDGYVRWSVNTILPDMRTTTPEVYRQYDPAGVPIDVSCGSLP